MQQRRYTTIKGLKGEAFRRLTGVKRETFHAMAGLFKAIHYTDLDPRSRRPHLVELVQMMVEQRMTETTAVSWAAAELGGAKLGDARLNRRLVRVAERLGAQPSASIPVACGGWAETQAAYRLLAHEDVDWQAVLTPHGECSLERMCPHPMVLCVQDSTELDYTAQPGIAGLGPLSDMRQHGLYVHPTLTVTPDGVLGVLDAWLWTRDRATFGEENGTGRLRLRKACAGWKASNAAPN